MHLKKLINEWQPALHWKVSVLSRHTRQLGGFSVCVCEALRLANTLAGLVHDGRSVIIYVYAQTHKITEHIALSCTGQQCVQVLCTVQHTSCL